MEIGSVYEISPEAAKGLSETRKTVSIGGIEKYGKLHTCLTASGREAIALAIQLLTIEHPEISKTCLLPAYMCDTVFLPFVQAGWKLFFYHVNLRMEAKKEELLEQMENVRPGLLFVHPYYGVDTVKPIRSFFPSWQQAGTYIMEDVTQSYYLRQPEYRADFMVGSLRKWYPVSDGGFLACDFPLPAELPENREFSGRRLSMLQQKWEYLYGKDKGNSQVKEAYLKENRRLEEELDEWDKITGISRISANILQHTNEEADERKRRENFHVLYQGLGNGEKFRYALENFREEAAGLYFPVYATTREDLQKCLQSRDIYAPVLWPIGKENGTALWGDEDYIFHHLLAIPIDQRYGREEMEKIVEVMTEYDRN